MDKYFEVFMEAAGGLPQRVGKTISGQPSQEKRQILVQGLTAMETWQDLTPLAETGISFRDAVRLSWLQLCWDQEFAVDSVIWDSLQLENAPVQAYQLWTDFCFSKFTKQFSSFWEECRSSSEYQFKNDGDADEAMKLLLQEEESKRVRTENRKIRNSKSRSKRKARQKSRKPVKDETAPIPPQVQQDHGKSVHDSGDEEFPWSSVPHVLGDDAAIRMDQSRTRAEEEHGASYSRTPGPSPSRISVSTNHPSEQRERNRESASTEPADLHIYDLEQAVVDLQLIEEKTSHPPLPVSEAPEECIICMEYDAHTTFFPCGHKNCCESCAKMQRETFGECPICRSLIKKMITAIHG